MENKNNTGQLGVDGHEAPSQLKNVQITQMLSNEAFNKATRAAKRLGFRSVQAYIQHLIIIS